MIGFYPVITNPARRHFKDGWWSWDGDRWGPQRRVFRVGESYFDSAYIYEFLGGRKVLKFNAVPAGKVLIMTGMSGFASDSSPAWAFVSVFDGDTEHIVFHDYYPGAWETVHWNGYVFVGEGEVPAFIFEGVGLQVELFAYLFGYLVNV